ncbi:hypothetical protein ACO1O0_005492 [Amphichorda felina]
MWQPQSPTEPTSSSPPAAVEVVRQKNPGRRFGQIVRLKPQFVAEYKACHAKVWPEVLKQIRDCNIQDCGCRVDLGAALAVSEEELTTVTDSIWWDDKSGILFASFKYVGYDYEGDMEAMAANPRVREWWRMTDSYQESMVEGAVSSEAGEPSWWKPVEEVFYQA